MKLLWLDLEMSGLDPDKDVILEVAAIITNKDLEELSSFQKVVHQSEFLLKGMDEWNTSHHQTSGLWNSVLNSKESLEQVEEDLLKFLDLFFKPNEKIFLAGNSIYHDRNFIKKYMQSLERRLHHRLLDVSSWKLIFFNKYNIQYKKQNTHRALDDIKESIAELQHYIRFCDFKKITNTDDTENN